MSLPKKIYPKTRKEDIDDAVLNSEYDEKLRKMRERESNLSKVNLDKVKELVIKLRKITLELDPNLNEHLEFFRQCYEFMKKLNLT